MSKAVIALKYLEVKHPLDLVEKIVKANGGSFGYSFVDADGVNPYGEVGKPDPKGLVESQDQVKAKTVYYFGAEAPKLDEDLQPWEMLRDSKNNIVCVGFFEGNFDGAAKADSSHIPAYHAKEVLARKLKMMLRSLKDNGEELYEFCKHDDFQEEIKELFTGDGSIVLHFFNDQLLWFCSPIDRKKTNEFGMFSDLCGWEGIPVTSVPQVKSETKVTGKGLDKLKAMMDARKSGTSGTPTEEKRTTEPPKQPQTPSVVPMERSPGNPTTYLDILKTKPLRTLTEEKVAGLLKAGGHFRHLENWYKNLQDTAETGTVWPAGYDRSKMMDLWNEIKNAEKSGTWKALVTKLPGVLEKKHRDEAKKEYAALVTLGLATDVTDKVTTSNKVEASKDNVVKVVTPTEGTDKGFPVMTEKGDKLLQEFVDKYFDKSHRVIPIDPSKGLKAYVEKHPDFKQKAGIPDWVEMAHLPAEAFWMLTNRAENAVLCMCSMALEIERLQKLVPVSQQAPADERRSPLAGLPGARKRA